MKRRTFIGSAIGTTIVSGISRGDGEPEATKLLESPAVVMAPRADGVEVVCAVSRLCRGWLEWKSSDGKTGTAAQDSFGFVPQAQKILKIRIQNLEPGTRYQLRLIVESADGGPAAREETDWKPFQTLNPLADHCHFAVWNDTHENGDTLRKLDDVTPTTDFLVWNGDVCNDWKAENQLVPILLNPGGRDISRGRPLLLTAGNHDVRGRWAFKVSECIAFPENRPFHALRHGPVAAIFLHTGEDKPDSHRSFEGRVAFEPLRREQKEWLKEIIQRPDLRDAPHKLVFCHIPLRWKNEPDSMNYEAGEFDHYSRASRDLWHDSLAKWGAQVIISGHTHQPAWIPADSHFPYAQLISGGPKPDAARWIEGTADGESLHLVMRDLQGGVTQEITLPRL